MPWYGVRLAEERERKVAVRGNLLSNGRSMGRLAERMPMLHSTLSQMPESTTVSVQYGYQYIFSFFRR